jgi:hypothetical protein
MQLLGAGYLGPFGHYFHIILEKIFKGKKDSKTVVKRVILQNLFFYLSASIHDLNSGLTFMLIVVNLLFFKVFIACIIS